MAGLANLLPNNIGAGCKPIQTHAAAISIVCLQIFIHILNGFGVKAGGALAFQRADASLAFAGTPLAYA